MTNGSVKKRESFIRTVMAHDFFARQMGESPSARTVVASNTRREPLVLKRQMNNRQREFLGFLLSHLTHSGKGPAA